MNCIRLLVLFSTGLISCHQSADLAKMKHFTECPCAALASGDSSGTAPYANIRGALLGSRFSSFEELKSVIQIEYDSTGPRHYLVRVRHCSGGEEVTAVLETGVSQGDMIKARYDRNIGNILSAPIYYPYAVSNRIDIEKIYTLSRWQYKKGDLAFIDIAKSSVKRINTPDLAFKNTRDTSEKGYLNSFNHITAQAFITSCFSEDLADFIADSHERYSHPELITGKFTQNQIYNLDDGPLDNYVDLINNEWGQNIGSRLKVKYKINSKTYWTPYLLTNYLNDLLAYYSWAFQIGFEPYQPKDEEVISFSNKINEVMK